MKKKVRAIAIMVVFFVFVIGMYYWLSNRDEKEKEQVEIPETKIEEILAKDLSSSDYPATPKTVLHLYSQMSKCFYDEDYTEEQYKELVAQYRMLLDQELLVNNPSEDHIDMLSAEIQSYDNADRFILVYYDAKDEEVQKYNVGGVEYATVPMTYCLKEGETSVMNTEEEFILRKDSEGKWKILGWRINSKEK